VERLPTLAEFMQQLYTGAIDPTTALFLPTVILSRATPLEPLAIDDYQWGDLAAVSSTLPADLCRAVGGTGGPGTHATLTLRQMRIVGLSNVLPDPPTVTGSAVSWRLQFGQAAALPPGVTVPPQLLIQGAFAVTLTGCGAQDGQVTGTFSVGFGGAAAEAKLNVAVKDVSSTEQDYTVTATGLSFTAGRVLFAFQADGAHGGTVNPLLRAAFNAHAGDTLLALIKDRLTAPATLTALGHTLTDSFTGIGNPNIIAFVAAILYKQAVSPAGSYYLPNEIKQATNPILEPFSAGGWDMTDIGPWYADAGQTICGAIGSETGDIEIQTPGTPVPVSLSSIEVAGTSNLLPLPLLVIGDKIWGMVTCNAVAGWPARLTVSGNFKLTVTCCPDENNTGICSGPSAASTGSGTFTATIDHATVSVEVTISSTGTEPHSKLIATADRIYFRCDPNTAGQQNIVIDIEITSVPAGERQAWNAVAKNVFNSPPATTAIVEQIRTRLDQAAVRDKLSAIATTAIQHYLPDNEQLTRRIRRELAMAARKRGAST
jgi:hypothetical protein